MVLKLLTRKAFSLDIHQQKDQPNDMTHHSLLKRIIHCILQRRHIVALLGSMCAAIIQSHRLNISIAMVAMVNNINSTMSANQDSNATEECPAYTSKIFHDQSRGEFEWSPELQGYIISAGYLGFSLSQIPGGVLAKTHGSKKLLVVGLLIASACNLLSPLAARANPYILMTLTLIRGMAQGIKQSALFVLMSKWFPSDERGVLCTFIYNGFSIGAVIAGLAGGKLCELEFLGGWPLNFYVFGFLSTVLAVIFMIFYHDTPEEDPRISDAELKHIQNNQEKRACSECPPIPWMRILLSVPFIALVVALFGAYWMNFYFLSVHPIYLGTIINLPIDQNGIQSATTFIMKAIAGWLTSYYCYRNKTFAVHTLRRGINSFSCLLFTIGMVGVYFSKCSIVLNGVFSHLAMFGSGFAYGGCFISAVDMSPTFCGPLMGLASSIGNLSGFVVPIVAGKLTNKEQSLTQWGKVFFSTMGVCFGSGLIFQLFGSAEIQPYDPVSIKYSEEGKRVQKREEPEESKGGMTSSKLSKFKSRISI